MKYILKSNLFVRSFGFRQGDSLRPSEVVRVVRRAQDDWLATPPGGKRTTKTKKSVKSETKNMKNEANLKPNNLTATSCGRVTYNDFYPKTQNGTKPNEANLKPILKRETRAFTGNTLPKNLFMRNEPNFKSPKFTANPCNRTVYNTFTPKTKNGTNPITNPIKANFVGPTERGY